MITVLAPTSLESLLVDGVRLFSEQVAPLDEDAWALPTPCPDWSVSRLVDHVADTAYGAAAILLGTERPPACPQDEAADRWCRAGHMVLAALSSTHDNSAPAPTSGAHARLPYYACDFAIHAWDLSVALDQETELPADWVDYMDTFFRSQPTQNLRCPRTFANPVPPADGDDATRVLMAFLGRRGVAQ